MTRMCHWCANEVPEKEWCPTCSDGFFTRTPAGEMTADEREAEMHALEWAEVPFGWIHQRIEQLVGRPVWTHEMGKDWEGLCKESRREGRPATIGEIIDLIPPEKRILVSVGLDP